MSQEALQEVSEGASLKSGASVEQGVAIVLLVLLVVSFGLRCAPILENSPYPRHVDEETFHYNSLVMLKNGTLRPQTMNWASLPLYLALAAESVGYLWQKATGNIEDRKAIRDDAFPYTPHPTIVLSAKLFFAAISVIPLLFVGLISWRLSDSLGALLLAPVVLSLNALYFYHSWGYLNVDVIGVFFIVAGLAYLILYADDRSSVLHKALLPGVFCGLAAACKYTNAALALPFLISIAFGDRKKLLLHAGLLFLVLGVSFAIAMPYAVIEPDRLVEWISSQRRIYSTGFLDHTIEAGLPHFVRQAEHLIEQYGAGACLLGLAGLVGAIVGKGRKGIALASYPIFFTIYYSAYRVDLVRNLLAVHVLFSIFIALGAVWITRFCRARLEGAGAGSLLAAGAASFLPAIVLIGTVPWGEVQSAYRVPEDSRLVAERWIFENVQEGTRLFIPAELRFDLRALEKVYPVIEKNLIRKQGYGRVAKSINRKLIRREAERGAYFLIPEYGWEYPNPDRIEAAREANASFAGGEVLHTFGSQPVRIQFFESVPHGDPRFSIRRGRGILQARSR